MSTSNAVWAPLGEEKHELIRLAVRAHNPFVEIVIVDGDFGLQGVGFGQMQKDLRPGIYRVDFKAGHACDARFAVLDERAVQGRVHIEGPRVSFESSVPLVHDGSPHAAAQAARAELATTWSAKPKRKAGTGSRIFVFATSDTSASVRPQHPLEGMSLLRATGAALFDIGQLADHAVDADAAGFCVDVEPGVYLLRTSFGRITVDQTLVALPGYATQVFTRSRAIMRSGTSDVEVVGADPTITTILTTPLDRPFDAHDPAAEATELARIAMHDGRRSGAPYDVLRLGDGSLDSPMLAILAAHLLVAANEAEENRPLLKEALGALTSVAGAHPDVLALRLWAGEHPTGWGDAERRALATPPILRSSWAILTRASAIHPELLSGSSLTSKMGDRVWGGGASLLWESVPGTWRLPGGRVTSASLDAIARQVARTAVPMRYSLGRSAGSAARSTGGGSKSMSAGAKGDPLAGAGGGGAAGGASPDDAAQPIQERAIKPMPIDRLPAFAAQLYEVARDGGGISAVSAKTAMSPLETSLLQYVFQAVESLRDAEGRIPELSSASRANAQAARVLSPAALVGATGVPIPTISHALGSLVHRFELKPARASKRTKPVADTYLGKFGGQRERNHRRLDARVEPLPADREWFRVTVRLVSTDPKRPVEGAVRFHVHETFPKPEVVVEAKDGGATWEGLAWGAFTVGVTCDDGATALEIDLATLEDAPPLFRSR